MHEEVLTYLAKARPVDLLELYSGPQLNEVLIGLKRTKLESYEDVFLMFLGMGYQERVATSHAEELLEWAWDQVTVQQLEEKREQLARFSKKGANRAEYTLEPLFEFYEFKPFQWRWKWSRELRNFGLMRLMVEQLHGRQDTPVAIAILHRKPTRPLKNFERKMWLTAMGKMVVSGVAISGQRLGWNRNTPGWPMLLTAFPQAVDCSAYNHGLNAPVIPQGYLPKVQITFRKIVNPVTGEDLCTDGSGIYHPDAPAMRDFVSKYGVVACQFRGLHPGDGNPGTWPEGLFVKGVLFPSIHALDENGEPAIVADWGQVKGKYKTAAKKCRSNDKVLTVDGIHIGLLQAWHRPQKLSGCFELLENIQVNRRTIELTHTLVDKAMGHLGKKGLSGIVSEVCNKDDVLSLVLKLVEEARAAGLPIQAYDIPRIRTAVENKLGKKLWKVGDSAGIKLPSYVCRLDACVPQGKAVVYGYPAGKNIVGFRFPLILAQGLIQLETMDPLPHHLVDDKLTPYTVVLNPADLTTGMQGDDDGDFMGITADETIVELFSHRIDENRFHIEPKGTPVLGKDGLPLRTDTPEGLEFLKHDHRGVVGLCTIWRAQLLAVGDLEGARAMSIAIQECVDAAKRRPEWSDIREAVHLSNWIKDGAGEYHFSLRFKPEELENGTFPRKLIEEWVESRLISKGCFDIQELEDGSTITVARNPLWYRKGGKRVNVSNWHLPEEDAKFENLVHIAFRRAHMRWHELAEDFTTSKSSTNLELLLPFVMAAKGLKASIQPMTWAEYRQGLRIKLGLKKYADAMKRLREEASETEEAEKVRIGRINEANRELDEHLLVKMATGEITLSDIATAWNLEFANAPSEGESHEDRGNPNQAIRLVCFQGSPVLKALGIEMEEKCRFLFMGKTSNRLMAVMDMCLSKSDPHEWLSHIISRDVRHERETRNEYGEGVPLHECPECTRTLQDTLVRIQRADKSAPEQEWLSTLYRSLK